MHDSQAAVVVAAQRTQEDVTLRGQVDSLWGEWSWQVGRDMRMEGYDSNSVRTFLQRIYKHRYEPNIVKVVSAAPTALANLIESRYDTLPRCSAEVAAVMERMVDTRGELLRAQAVICEHP
jgi:hypothetical protein